jgi:hypothetical protein
MFVNILLFTFVSAFLAIVALGHVLLVTAIWPGAFKKPRESSLDIAPDASPTLTRQPQ